MAVTPDPDNRHPAVTAWLSSGRSRYGPTVGQRPADPVTEMSATPFNQRTIDEFHAKLGRGIGGWGDNVLLMTCTGRRKRRGDNDPAGLSEARRPLRGGRPPPTAEHPSTRSGASETIETFEATARVVSDEAERNARYEFLTMVWPQFTDYAARTS